MLPIRLLDFDFYKDKLPLYLRTSETFLEHFKIWYELLLKNDANADVIFSLINIFDDNILNIIADMDGSGATDENPYGDVSDMLDKIGELVGVSRRFELSYVNAENVNVKENLVLNNEDFLFLIKAQLVKNNCDGTYEIMEQFYEDIGLTIFVTTSTVYNATANVYMNRRNLRKGYYFSQDVVKMFLGGLLTIQSLGITYNYYYIDLDYVLYWDNNSSPLYQVIVTYTDQSTDVFNVDEINSNLQIGSSVSNGTFIGSYTDDNQHTTNYYASGDGTVTMITLYNAWGESYYADGVGTITSITQSGILYTLVINYNGTSKTYLMTTRSNELVEGESVALNTYLGGFGGEWNL